MTLAEITVFSVVLVSQSAIPGHRQSALACIQVCSTRFQGQEDNNEKDPPNRYRCAAPGNGDSAHNNLTDDQLSDAVCKKFYSDMPQEQFSTGGALIRFLALSAIAFASAAHAQMCQIVII